MPSLEVPKQAVSQRMFCSSCGGLVCILVTIYRTRKWSLAIANCLKPTSNYQVKFFVWWVKAESLCQSCRCAFAKGFLKWRNKPVKQLVKMKWSQQQELGKQREGKDLRHWNNETETEEVLVRAEGSNGLSSKSLLRFNLKAGRMHLWYCSWISNKKITIGAVTL